MSKRAEEFSIKYADNKLAIVDKELSETNYHRHTKMGVSIFDGSDIEQAAMDGYEQAEKDLGWHSVKEFLPPMNEEVIVLIDNIHGKIVPDLHYICYGHIVDKNIAVDYDGWNIPGVTHWMPCPKLEEK